MNFANYFSDLRKATGLSMRKFATTKGYDVGYISRIEAGITRPPVETEKMEALAAALEIRKETKQWVEFFDLAAASRAELPADLKEDQAVLNLLPAFYRTLRREKISEDEVDKLLEKLTGASDETRTKGGSRSLQDGSSASISDGR